MSKSLLVITMLIILTNCVSDERSACEQSLEDDTSSRALSCTPYWAFAQSILKKNPSAINDPGSEESKIYNFGILLCLEERIRSNNCKKKSSILPVFRKNPKFSSQG
ncbi:MAG: hypothetical protein KDK36_20865 [Leptospiraceae bacterium]|nr:hypothetical protein [Leptospiraceae bacterium]